MAKFSKNINNSVETYLTTPYEKFKSYERFGFVKKIIAKKLRDNSSFLDIGCAKGEFIWFLKDYFPTVRFSGLDISKKLIVLARKQPKLKDVNLRVDDAQDFNLKRKFDIVYMGGVLTIFDDIQKPLNQINKHLISGGWGYIFSSFTEDDIDVLIRYKNNYCGSKKWESGLNMFSLETTRKFISKFSRNIRFYKFNLSINLRKENNPLKSFTLNTREKGRIIANGANIITDFYLVEFRKS